MIKIFLTGDNHFGKKFSRYSGIEEDIKNSRFETFDKMVEQANEEGCHLFVVSGDLFDKLSGISKKDIEKITDSLGKFSGTVLVLPGNHDYNTGEESLWKDFERKVASNTIVLDSYRMYPLNDVNGEEVHIYPAHCDKKNSEENKLDWIKNEDVDNDVINIGIAHGAIEGIAPDMKNEYFLMTEKELNDIPMDLWLIGHVHIPFPRDLKENEETENYTIFNAGTHEQLDLNNNTDGEAFVISVEKDGGKAKTKAHKFVSGIIKYKDLDLEGITPKENALKDGLEKLFEENNVDEVTIVRVCISGSIKKEEYDEKEKIYHELEEKVKWFERDDSNLTQEITPEMIKDEFPEYGFKAKFLNELIGNNVELQMAYDMVKGK